MNSEELELSLRTEFESYLKGVLAGLRQDVSDFQKNFEAEFEKHKAQMNAAIQDLSSRFEADTVFDKAFTESVIEHLRLARDEGAEIAATAFGEAEKLREDTATPANYDRIRDAINDISSKTSQSAILKALVDHASQFTPRGAFFIIKNDHFVGWKVFGKEGTADEAAVREVHFPLSADTLLAASVNALATEDGPFGTHADDNVFLDKLEFGRPDRMYAVPLTARGRGVAVLYADYGKEGVELNVEALETLVRVAGLTVELLAASQAAKLQPAVQPEPVQRESASAEPARVDDMPEPLRQPEAVYQAAEPEASGPAEFEYTGEVAVEEPSEAPPFESEAEAASAYEVEEEESYFEPVDQEASESEPAPAEIEEPERGADFSFAPPQPAAGAESEAAGPEHSYTADKQEQNGNGHGAEPEHSPEPVAAGAGMARQRDRNVDLPIDVTEEERPLHSAARRFARLLVSEIKLYNEQKVNEGRESADLYDRLREAIDRSREMYDKRVQPEVAAKFDYFHYELVNSLAEGSESKLGGSYPGAA